MGDQKCMAYILIAPLIGQFVNTIIQISWNHITKGKSYLSSIVWSFLFGWVVQVLLTCITLYHCTASTQDWIGALGLNSMAALGFGYCYFTFVNLLKTSLRIRVLDELQGGRKTGMTKSELSRIYDTKDVTNMRIFRLESWGQIKRNGDKLYPVHGSFYQLALVLRWLKKMMGLPIGNLN
jgi:hypothetical protein